jgi:hypothetical protein
VPTESLLLRFISKVIFMKIVFVFTAVIALTLFFSINANSQNKFEGYNIILDVPDTQQSATCAIRYAPPTTNITITDLNPATPMKVRSCAGSGSRLTQNGSTATMQAGATDFKWCFEGEDKKYRISYSGDRFSGNITYDWITTPEERNLGFYNIKDFGAKGDGRTDDTIAVKSAMAFIATRNGGNLTFPEGEYIVSSTIALPSGIVIQGINGLHSGASTNNVVQKNNSRITLKGTNRALFRIGECTEKVTIKDIELYGQSTQNTFGIEAVGAYISSQDFYFERVSFNNFYRGINVRGLPVNNLQWQFDYVKINHCRFIYNTDTGLYANIRNSDWKIESSLFINPARTATQNANSMHFERVGMVLIEDTFGGGFSNAKGGTFINVLDSGNLTIIGSQTEAMTNSLVYNEVNNPYAGDYSYPITVVNSIFGDPIIFKARRTFVSTGSHYGANTFTADERVRIYSTGDRFCYDGYILGCQSATRNNFDKATVIFMTGQPSEREVPASPTVFGTDVQFGSSVQLPSFLQNALPTGKANGSMVYCSNCKRSSTPCQAGGTGAPAMVVNNQWSCL